MVSFTNKTSWWAHFSADLQCVIPHNMATAPNQFQSDWSWSHWDWPGEVWYQIASMLNQMRWIVLEQNKHRYISPAFKGSTIVVVFGNWTHMLEFVNDCWKLNCNLYTGHTCFTFDFFTGNEVLSKITLPVLCSLFMPSDFWPVPVIYAWPTYQKYIEVNSRISITAIFSQNFYGCIWNLFTISLLIYGEHFEQKWWPRKYWYLKFQVPDYLWKKCRYWESSRWHCYNGYNCILAFIYDVTSYAFPYFQFASDKSVHPHEVTKFGISKHSYKMKIFGSPCFQISFYPCSIKPKLYW